MRAPVPFRPGIAVWTVLILGTASGVSHATWTVGPATRAPWLWGGMLAFALGHFLSALWGMKLVARWAAPEGAEVPWWHWLRHLLAFHALPLPTAALYEAFSWWGGWSTRGVGMAIAYVLMYQLWVPMVVLYLEHDAWLWHQAEAEDKALDEALATAAAQRFALGQVLDRERRLLWGGLEEEVLAKLRALGLRATEAGPPPGPAWTALMAEVAALADQEARAFSHRLHPEAIRFGLLPAAAALFDAPEVRDRAGFGVDEALADAPALKAGGPKALALGLHRLMALLLAQWLEDAPPEAMALAHLEALPEGAWGLRWGGLGPWPWPEGGPQGPRWTLLRARVGVLGGDLAWRPLGEWGEGPSLLISLPAALAWEPAPSAEPTAAQPQG